MDDLKTTNEPVQPEPIPQPTEPAAPPTDQPTTEPSSPQPVQTTPPITTVTTEEPLPPTPTIEKPPGKKIPSPIKIGGALVILLMAATLPATIILVQNKTQLAPKAEETTVTPRKSFRNTGGAYIILREEEQQLEQAQPIKPRDLKIEAVAPGKTTITFNTLVACSSSISYSPDENWNYLTMMQESDVGDEWQERYHYQNEKRVQPVAGDTATTEHEFVLENLISSQKYYFAIEVKNPSDNNVYLFGLEQPENHYVFIAQ